MPHESKLQNAFSNLHAFHEHILTDCLTCLELVCLGRIMQISIYYNCNMTNRKMLVVHIQNFKLFMKINIYT